MPATPLAMMRAKGCSSFAKLLFFCFSAALCSCARNHDLGVGLGATLLRDCHAGAIEGLVQPGQQSVQAIAMDIEAGGRRIPVVLYRPATVAGQAPAIVFLPGRFAPEDQYESYGRLLASLGFVVLERGRYGWFYPDDALVRDAAAMTSWLQAREFVDPRRIGAAGHSMGARDAIWAAVRDARIRSVVALDPSAASAPWIIRDVVPRIRVPLLLVGADVAWRASRLCAPRGTNYANFFENSPGGTVEIVIHGADHVQVMDDPDRFGYQICRVGSSPSRLVRALARSAMAQFFRETLAGTSRVPLSFGKLAELRVRPAH